MTDTAPWNKKVGFCRPFFGNFHKMTRIFTPSFLVKVGIVQTCGESISECYITYIYVGLLDTIFLAQIPLSLPRTEWNRKDLGYNSGYRYSMGTIEEDIVGPSR